MKISAFTILSEIERLNYPYIESLKSFLPICDELIAVCNSLEKYKDGSLERIKNEIPEIQIIGGIFDYPKLGWLSQGIMRTNGYYASTGDIVLMFDADDILHEKSIENLSEFLTRFSNSESYYAFWRRYKFRKLNYYTIQNKYPGIFNKNKIGNNFNFYGAYLAEGNWNLLPNTRGLDSEFYLYGYERLWEDLKTLKYNLINSKLENFPEGKINVGLTDEEYIKNWILGNREKVRNGLYMGIEEQPLIIQDKLRIIDNTMYGYSQFEGII